MKTNPIIEIYKLLSTNDLILVINEIESCEKTGTFPENSLFASCV